MRVLLDIKDNEADFVLELLNRLSSIVTATKLDTDDIERKEGILSGIQEALKEVKLHQEGKIKLQSARELLNEI